MVNIEESLACWQLVRLFNLLEASDCQEHADWRTQGKEVHWFKVQSVVDHWHLQSKTLIAITRLSTSSRICNQLYNHTYLSSANFKVIVVDVDGGDGVSHRKLLHRGIRESFSCLWRRHSWTDLLHLCFLLLSCLTCSLPTWNQDREKLVSRHDHHRHVSLTDTQKTNLPAYSLFLWQTWRSFSWDPVGFPSPSSPQ